MGGARCSCAAIEGWRVGDSQATEALHRVREFMRDNDVFFNGAGDANLPSVEQAWSLNHLDGRYKEQNWRTIDTIVTLLQEEEGVHQGQDA